MKAVYRRSLGIWLTLLALLALTCGSAFVSMGQWNAAANLAISAAKALLVAWFFMHLGERRQPVFRLTALAALFMLALLVGLTLADYSTRGPS
jgi:cytochrome c oxidase subunit 4